MSGRDPSRFERVDVREMTVSEVRDFVADCENRELVEAMRDVEAETKERKTALEAIDDRLDALDGDEDEGEEADADDRQDGDDADTDAESGHGTLPRSSATAPTETVVVRNPHKTTLHLQGLPGSIPPGETREYPQSDTLQKYIRENTVQVVTTNR